MIFTLGHKLRPRCQLGGGEMLLINFYENLPICQCKLMENVECLDAKKQQVSKTRAVNGKLGDACLIPVDEPARQVPSPPEEEIKSPTKAAKKKHKAAKKSTRLPKKAQASVKEGVKSREPDLVNMGGMAEMVDAEASLMNLEAMKSPFLPLSPSSPSSSSPLSPSPSSSWWTQRRV